MRFSPFRSVLFTSLPAFILAEVFFAGVYYTIVTFSSWMYLLYPWIGGTQIETNMDLINPLNIMITILVMTVLSIVTCIEIATIIGITVYDHFRHDHIPLRALMTFAYHKVRDVVSWGAFPILIAVFFFPKAHIGPDSMLMFDFPDFFMNEIWAYPPYVGVYLMLVCIIGYLIYRSVFFIHVLLLEESDIRVSLERSWYITRRMGYVRMVVLLLRSAILAVVFTIPTYLVSLLLVQLATMSVSMFGGAGLAFVQVFSWFRDFIIVSLPSVLLLAGLTLGYIRHAGYTRETLVGRFVFLSDLGDYTPRWKNIRKLLHDKKVLIWASLMVLPISASGIYLLDRSLGLDRVVSPLIIAHRGSLSGSIIENTRRALDQALVNHADIIEIDVQMDASGTLVLSHDPDLARIAGIRENIRDMSDRDIAHIVLPDGSPLMTLEQALIYARENQVTLMIEPKVTGHEPYYAERLVDLIHRTGMSGHIMIHSLDIAILSRIHELDPDISRGYIIFGGFGNFGSLPVDFFSLEERMISQRVVDDIHSYQKKVYVWIVNDPKKLQKLKKIGVDGVLTDDVRGMRGGR